MNYSLLVLTTLLTGLLSCKNDSVQTLNCNDLVSAACSGTDNTPYCTVGYKWGSSNPFTNPGPAKPGPGVGQVEVSYKFQDPGLLFDTHSQTGVKSTSFDNQIGCTRQKIRDAFTAWTAVTNLTFTEQTGTGPADIRVIVADITQGGIGYPPIPNQACGGLVIFRSNAPNRNCNEMYRLALHEIGHALGLGHVTSDNIMNPNKPLLNLQPGDIQGIQSIYGKK